MASIPWLYRAEAVCELRRCLPERLDEATEYVSSATLLAVEAAVSAALATGPRAVLVLLVNSDVSTE